MNCWARHRLLLIVAALGTGQMLAACGQKGNLYLPPPEARAAASRPAAPAQPEPVTPPSPQPQGAGEGLQVLDKVQTGEPDVSGM